jgi:hypothetical protein
VRLLTRILACAFLLACLGCATTAQQMSGSRCDGPPVVTVRNQLSSAVEVHAQSPTVGTTLIGIVEANSVNTFDGPAGPGVTFAIRYRVAGREAALSREQAQRVRLSVSCR